MTLYFFVEGDSDQYACSRFFAQWVKSLYREDVRIDWIDCGGFGSYRTTIRERARLHLALPGTIGGIGLVDLYQPHYMPDELDPMERYRRAKQEFEGKVAEPRFRQHFAVHETEAWVIAAIALGADPDVRKQLGDAAERPEEINHDAPPSKRLISVFQEVHAREYRKKSDGSRLLGAADPVGVAARCPYLRDRLLADLAALLDATGVPRRT